MGMQVVLEKGGDVGPPGGGVEMWRAVAGILCYDKEVVWGVLTSSNEAWFSWLSLSWWCVSSLEGIQMVHWSVRNNLTVADKLYIQRRYWQWRIYFSSLCSCSLDSKASYDLETAATGVLSGLPQHMSRALLSWLQYHVICYQYHQPPTLSVRLEWVSYKHTWNWMCLHSSTRCKYCLELCTVSCSTDLGPYHHPINICNNCIDKLPPGTGFEICPYQYQLQYSNAKVWL